MQPLLDANCFTTGFEDKELVSHAISIFPNPTTDIVYLKGEISKVKIYDNNGRVVLTAAVNELLLQVIKRNLPD